MQRKLHPLEGIVAMCALVLVLFLSVGFAQADEIRKINLRSSSALVLDAETGEIVYGKNAEAVVPIASITKLMTAMVILDRGLDLDEKIVLKREDAVSRSRLRAGLSLTRGDLLLLALMSSENRAAAALGRSYPGGMEAFVDAMNAKAAELDMNESRFVEPTGLSPANVSSAHDLAKLVRAAHDYPLIREYSTKERATVRVSTVRATRPLRYGNTNGLVRSSYWDIELSKTGYISEAGRCLVMHVRLASKDLIVVLLDSWGKHSRIGDANRIRKWLESGAAPGRSS
jgi:D-alanyl-D-alanine endopeptidase (penicillin-binding protein 7)